MVAFCLASIVCVLQLGSISLPNADISILTIMAQYNSEILLSQEDHIAYATEERFFEMINLVQVNMYRVVEPAI